MAGHRGRVSGLAAGQVSRASAQVALLALAPPSVWLAERALCRAKRHARGPAPGPHTHQHTLLLGGRRLAACRASESGCACTTRTFFAITPLNSPPGIRCGWGGARARGRVRPLWVQWARVHAGTQRARARGGGGDAVRTSVLTVVMLWVGSVGAGSSCLPGLDGSQGLETTPKS